MCGIAGMFDRSGKQTVTEGELRQMLALLRHRGPDGDGYWLHPDGHAGFAHRRLSIIDLSSQGRQPMANPANDLFVVFNGEVFN